MDRGAAGQRLRYRLFGWLEAVPGWDVNLPVELAAGAIDPDLRSVARDLSRAVGRSSPRLEGRELESQRVTLGERAASAAPEPAATTPTGWPAREHSFRPSHSCRSCDGDQRCRLSMTIIAG